MTQIERINADFSEMKQKTLFSPYFQRRNDLSRKELYKKQPYYLIKNICLEK